MSIELIDYQKLAAAMGPMLDGLEQRLTKSLTEQVIPALGVQFQAAVIAAIKELNQDAPAAISQLGDRVEAMVPKLQQVGMEMLAGMFDRVDKILADGVRLGK